MISKELIQQFKAQIPEFEEAIRAFENGDLNRNALKGISGRFGSYAQKENGYMLRLRLPAGVLSMDTLRFITDKIRTYQVDLLKLTTCQTIQFHNLDANGVISLVKEALDFGIITIGGGGDNPRNVMCSPLSGVQPGECFDVLDYAQTAGEYLIAQIPRLHLPRKLKVGFSNSPANETHATFRDLGFVAAEDHTFSVYCAGGLGPNPKLGVPVFQGADPSEITLYLSAMIRLFLRHGNYESRAKARTRYLQDTLGTEKLRSEFLDCLKEARAEEQPWPVTASASVTKQPAGSLSEEYCTHPRVLPQKQEGLYTVSYHPLGGRLSPEFPGLLYNVLSKMEEVCLRLGPDGTLYILNLNAQEVPSVIAVTDDGARSLFETGVCCIGSPICQHGIRNSYQLLIQSIIRVREENLPDQALPQIHISGCPSSCGTHQSAILGFAGHSRKVDGVTRSAFKLFVDGQCAETAKLGEEAGVLLETVIPDFLAELGRITAKEQLTFTEWYPCHKEEFEQLVRHYESLS